jgi:hypothetical protein
MPAPDGLRTVRLLHPQAVQQKSTPASEIEPPARLVSIPLTDDEQTTVEDGQAALDHLLQRLADIPTPAGTTPRQLTSAISLPIVAVNHGRSART